MAECVAAGRESAVVSEIQADLEEIRARFESGEITLRLALDHAWRSGYFDRTNEGDKSSEAVNEAIAQLRGAKRELTEDEARLLSRLLDAEWVLMRAEASPWVTELLANVRAAQRLANLLCGGDPVEVKG